MNHGVFLPQDVAVGLPTAHWWACSCVEPAARQGVFARNITRIEGLPPKV